MDESRNTARTTLQTARWATRCGENQNEQKKKRRRESTTGIEMIAVGSNGNHRGCSDPDG
jgi:hypothetical protein